MADGASEALFRLVYDDLRDLAGRMLRNERSDHTLQATALARDRTPHRIAFPNVSILEASSCNDRAT